MIADFLKKPKARKPCQVKAAQEPQAVAPPPEEPTEVPPLAARVELTIVAKAKKKPIQCDLRLLPEGRLLVWGQGNDVGEGDVVDLADVKEAALVHGAPKQLRVTTNKTALSLLISFTDHQIVGTWQKAITEVCGRIQASAR
jgi:hypothetical protein